MAAKRKILARWGNWRMVAVPAPREIASLCNNGIEWRYEQRYRDSMGKVAWRRGGYGDALEDLAVEIGNGRAKVVKV